MALDQFAAKGSREQGKDLSVLEARRIRGYAILAKGDMPVMIDKESFYVPSQSDSSKRYKVTSVQGWICECPDYQNRKLECKHIQSIKLFLKLRNKAEYETLDLPSEISNKATSCPYCNSEQVIKRGTRKTQTEEKQRFSCKECKRKFVISPIPKIKGNAKLVCLAMDCYYKGLSYRDISDQFKQFYGLSISHVTIRDWILKFGRVMDKYAKTLTPESSGLWNADETMVLTKKGTLDYEYLWNVLDNKTKFILASVNSGKGRSSKDAQAVMTEAYKQTGKTPEKIITDKLASYQDGIRKTFRNWGNERKVKHVSILGRRKIINNNAVENLHTHQKEFQKVRRGMNEVQGYADGFRVFHNFVRQGVKDKLTPADRSGIGITGTNKWETLLLQALKLKSEKN